MLTNRPRKDTVELNKKLQAKFGPFCFIRDIPYEAAWISFTNCWRLSAVVWPNCGTPGYLHFPDFAFDKALCKFKNMFSLFQSFKAEIKLMRAFNSTRGLYRLKRNSIKAWFCCQSTSYYGYRNTCLQNFFGYPMNYLICGCFIFVLNVSCPLMFHFFSNKF